MNYTDEEFYGNTQNTVLENGDVVPVGKQNQEESQFKMGLSIFVTCLKTLVLLVGAIYFVFATTVSLSPKSAIKIYEFLGAEKATLSCYERIYYKTETLADLYNLVQKSIQTKDYERTSKYIEKLQNKNEYVGFCIEVNNATKQVTNKEYIAYVGDLDGYLISQNILALYNVGKTEESESVAIADLQNDNKFSLGLATYIDCALADSNKTLTEKNEWLVEIANSTVVEMGNKTILEQLQSRRMMADISNASENDADKIMHVYTCLKIESLKLKIYVASNDESLASETRSQISTLQEMYNNLTR